MAAGSRADGLHDPPDGGTIHGVKIPQLRNHRKTEKLGPSTGATTPEHVEFGTDRPSARG
jgi:hypothetical protein